MTPLFRVLLLIAALYSLWFVLRHIRKGKLLITDSLFWFFFALVVLLLAIFPEIAEWAAAAFGVVSPVNLVYLVIIALLIMRHFKLLLRLAKLEMKQNELVQRLAIEENSAKKKSVKD